MGGEPVERAGGPFAVRACEAPRRAERLEMRDGDQVPERRVDAAHVPEIRLAAVHVHELRDLPVRGLMVRECGEARGRLPA
jgi:hypothetical protein